MLLGFIELKYLIMYLDLFGVSRILLYSYVVRLWGLDIIYYGWEVYLGLVRVEG